MLNGLDEAVLIMVIGYRLSATGFFSLPELRAENGDKAGAGNQGFLDQIEGLKWAKRNAKFFGTLDNPRITVFGESAGAYDIAALVDFHVDRAVRRCDHAVAFARRLRGSTSIQPKRTQR